MIKKQGKRHEHEVLYRILKTDASWDLELDDLMEKNRWQFEKDFERDIKDISFTQQFREYVSKLTNLERYFLGV